MASHNATPTFHPFSPQTNTTHPALPPLQTPAYKHPLVSLDTLSPQQLTAVKKQLDEEVEHLSGSYSQLAAAQAKFKECLRVVQTGSKGFDSGPFPAPPFFPSQG